MGLVRRLGEAVEDGSGSLGGRHKVTFIVQSPVENVLVCDDRYFINAAGSYQPGRTTFGIFRLCNDGMLGFFLIQDDACSFISPTGLSFDELFHQRISCDQMLLNGFYIK